MGVEPTVNSPSLLVLKPGNKDLNGLVADVQKGILVTGFNGGNCNSSSGDFSYGIEGFLIENGKLTQPVSEMNVTGNMITLWASLSAVGNDPRMSSSWRIPVAGIRRRRLQRIVRTVNSALNSCKGLMAIISFR